LEHCPQPQKQSLTLTATDMEEWIIRIAFLPEETINSPEALQAFMKKYLPKVDFSKTTDVNGEPVLPTLIYHKDGEWSRQTVLFQGTNFRTDDGGSFSTVWVGSQARREAEAKAAALVESLRLVKAKDLIDADGFVQFQDSDMHEAVCSALQLSENGKVPARRMAEITRLMVNRSIPMGRMVPTWSVFQLMPQLEELYLDSYASLEGIQALQLCPKLRSLYLYGVTGWSFDFRGHKLLGDWQAALGVTLRVPHLSWMSMEGDAKRDYPASIFFQSPWYREYPLIEDHFARVNTALTRGKPLVHVAVIHPIESYWLHWGPMDQTAAVREQMEAHFQQVTEWLLFGGIDFDFLCESLLPELCPTGGAPLKVGEMTYDAVIVPGCETLRSTTLERLEAFRQAGGRLIFLAEAPTLENGALSRRGKALWERSVHVAMERTLLLDALSPLREVELRDASSGQMTKHLLHQLRQDGDGRWLFIANGKEPYNLDISSRMSLRIILRGKWKPTLWNTLDGSTVPVPHHTEKETTIVEVNLYDCDSLLFHLEPVESSAYVPDECVRPAMQLTVPPLAALRLEEPNVLLMDQAMYALDNEQWQPMEELLRIRQKLHRRLGWKTNEWQPWRLPAEKPEHTIRLRFRFHCAQAMSGCRLAMEKRGEVSLWLDGQPIVPIENGWYVDPCIKTSELPCLSAGSHTLEVIRPFTPRTCLEWVYLLGNFRVKLSGRLAMLEPVQEEKAGYASLTEQGIPFYGGNASYVFDIETHGGALRLRVPQWRGALIAASIDGQDMGRIAFPPYSIETSPLPAGMHQICLKLFGTRANTFGPLHLADEKETWIGPGAWCSSGDAWTYEYRLKPFGILSSSQVEEIEGSVRKSCARNQHG